MTTEATFDMNRSLSAGKNITDILKHILTGYEKLIRPAYSGPPVLVGITSKNKFLVLIQKAKLKKNFFFFYK